MSVSNTPYWFALVILLRGAKARPSAASCRSYWSSLIASGESLLCRLQSEFAIGYSDDPPDFPEEVKTFVKRLHVLGDQPLANEALSEFKNLVEAVLAAASPHLGAEP